MAPVLIYIQDFMAWRAKRGQSSVSIQERKIAMAGNNRQKKPSSFSIFSIFKSFCSSGRDNSWDEAGNYGRRVCPRDDDIYGWVAEPGIDRKASDFIAKFYATRVSDPQTHAV